MRKYLLAAALLVAAIPAHADVYVSGPWGFVPVLRTMPYGGWRIPPGFQAPPLPNPYARTIAEQFICCGPKPRNVILPSPPGPPPLREFPIK